MKLIAEIIDKDNFINLDLDGYIFSYLTFHTIANQPLNLIELKNAVFLCHQYHKLAILKIDQWIEEIQLESLYQFLSEIEQISFDYVLFSDFSVLNYFEQKNQTQKLIYTAKTLNCSYEDISYWDNKQIKVVLSHEISLKDIERIATLPNLVIDGFGYSVIFYSKRKLLSLYSDKYQAKMNLDQTFFKIQEENKKEEYPIYQNQSGTFIFSQEPYGFIKELLTISNFAFYKIDTIMMSDSQLKEVIDTIRFVEKNKQLPKQVPSHHSPFLYQKNLILKEEDE